MSLAAVDMDFDYRPGPSLERQTNPETSRGLTPLRRAALAALERELDDFLQSQKR